MMNPSPCFTAHTAEIRPSLPQRVRLELVLRGETRPRGDTFDYALHLRGVPHRLTEPGIAAYPLTAAQGGVGDASVQVYAHGLERSGGHGHLLGSDHASAV